MSYVTCHCGAALAEPKQGTEVECASCQAVYGFGDDAASPILHLKLALAGPDPYAKAEIARLIHDSLPEETKEELLSLNTEPAPTLFFNFHEPSKRLRERRISVSVGTVPEQLFYSATARLILKGVDGVVIVLSSRSTPHEAELSLARVRDLLSTVGRDLSAIRKVGLAYVWGEGPCETAPVRNLLGSTAPIFRVSQGQAKELMKCVRQTLELVLLEAKEGVRW